MLIHRTLPLFLSALLLFAAPAFSDEPKLSPSDLAHMESQVKEALHLNVVDLQEITFPEEDWGDRVVEVDLGGVRHTLSLYPYSVRSWKFRLLVQDGTGTLQEMDPPAPRTLAGKVLGEPNSDVAASLTDVGLTANIILDDDERWFVQPVRKAVPGAPPSLHAVYRERDVRPGYWKCGTTHLHRVGVNGSQNPCGNGGGGFTLAGTGLSICEIAFDADYEYYIKNGASVANTMWDIENVVNSMRVVYERDVDITFEVTVIVVRTTSADPYSSNDPDTLLNQFGNEWNANMAKVERDVAHLATGKNLLGGTIGVAWLGVVCDKSQAYSLTELKYGGNFNQRTALICHEVGHNWNANHCDGDGDCHIMCSVLGGCNGIGLPNFGADAVNRISNYLNYAGCLDDQQDPVAPPFFDDFPTTTIDVAKWSHINGAKIKTDAVNMPSDPNTLHIDASGPEPYAEDEIRTNFILLGGLSGAEVRYYTQHIGVENGEKLVVEYWNNNFTWKALNTLVSDGVDQSVFDFHFHSVPADGLHDQFRLRFRTEVNERFDNWYIDDVFVGEQVTDPPTIASVTPNYDLEAGGAVITITGQNFTTNPVMNVRIGGVYCTSLVVYSDTTLTCITPAMTEGWYNVRVSNTFGKATLEDGFRYFPQGNLPFNSTAEKTESITTPETIHLIVSGAPLKAFAVFYGFGPGPIPSAWGTLGITPPFWKLLLSGFNAKGYAVLPLAIPSGFGPVDLYMHALGEDGSKVLHWAYGGNNPNGSGSIWFHLNN